MKHTYFLLFLALCATSNSHAAAARPAITIAETAGYRQRAIDAGREDNFTTFEEIIRKHPDVIKYKNNKHEDPSESTILSYIIAQHLSRDRSGYITTLLQQGAQLSENDLQFYTRWIITSICRSHPEEDFAYRLKPLISFYGLIKSASLPKYLATDTVTTPQQWLRNYAKKFLEGKTCTECNKPWDEHPPINPDYTARLREALELP